MTGCQGLALISPQCEPPWLNSLGNYPFLVKDVYDAPDTSNDVITYNVVGNPVTAGGPWVGTCPSLISHYSLTFFCILGTQIDVQIGNKDSIYEMELPGDFGGSYGIKFYLAAHMMYLVDGTLDVDVMGMFGLRAGGRGNSIREGTVVIEGNCISLQNSLAFFCSM